MNDQELYSSTISALFVKPGAGGANIKTNTFLMRMLILFVGIFFFSLSRVDAQLGYIYVHQSTVDESSNPTTAGSGFKYTVAGGGTTVPTFILNDAPTTPVANGTFGTPTGDVGASTAATLYSATPSGLFYRTAGSATWKSASTIPADRVDGIGVTTLVDGAVFSNSSSISGGPAANRGLYLYVLATNSTKLILTTSSDIQDVAYDRVNDRVLYIDNANNIYYLSYANALLLASGVTKVSGVNITFTPVKNVNNATRLDIDSQGNIFYMDDNGTPYLVKNYTNNTNNSSPTITKYTQLNNIDTPHDVACADDGSYFLAAVATQFGVFKMALTATSGASGSATYTAEPQSGETFNLTGGPAGQVWSNYYTNMIWTRASSSAGATWIDDERVRTTTTINGNSEMIAVAPGTYTITQDATTPANWNLQTVNIYDPSNNSSSSVLNSTATVTVAANEVVNVIYQNYYGVSTPLSLACDYNSPALFENFGSGSSGTLASIATGNMVGATSYHFYGTTKGALNDGYYGLCTNSNDVGYGNNVSSSYVTTKDHTTGTTGNYLFVNASFQKDVFYQREFTNLIPGNIYTVSYWIANITGSNKVGAITNLIAPRVTAKITDPGTGNLLASADSKTIDTVGVWESRSFSFKLNPGQTTCNFSLVNNADGGNGNDLGIDDIRFSLATSPVTAATVQNTCDGLSTVTITSPVNPTSGTAVYQFSFNGGAFDTAHIYKNVAQQASYKVISRYVGSPASCNSAITLTDVARVYKWTGTNSTDITLAANWGGTTPPFDGTASIEIPVVGTGRYPVLTADESIFSLQIDGGAANINLGAHTLNVGCNIYNSTTGGLTTGTYPAGGILTGDLTNSTLNWNGSSPTQKYVGNPTAGTAKLGNMTVTNTYNNGAGVVTMSAGPIDIYNVLTLAEGNLTIPSAVTVPNTQLTLKSTATQTAAVAEIKSPGTGISTPVLTTSTVNVERYLTGGTGYRGYKLISSPVYVNTVNGVNVIGLKYINTTVGANHGALVGGPGGTANGFDVPNGNPTIYLYDETKLTNNKNFTTGKNIGIYSYTPVSGVFPVNGYQYTTIYNTNTTPGVTIPVANSYIFFFIGDNSSLATSTGRTIQNTTITATGNINQGDIPFTMWTTKAANLSFTAGTGASIDGLNQVGNPYPSTIDLEQLYQDNWSSSNNINSTFYELNEPGQNYISYQIGGATSSTRAGRYIVSGQGFLAGAKAPNQTLVFHEDQKVDQKVNPQLISTPPLTNPPTPALLLSVKLPTALTGLHLQLTNDADTTVNTETGVYFSDAWADAYKASEDAIDLGGTAPKVYLSSITSDNIKVGINELGSYLKNKRIKLYVNATANGQYHIDMPDAKNIDTLYNIYVVDKLLKDSVDLRGDKHYDFAINLADTTTFGANRFELAVELKQMAPYQLLSFTGQKASAGIQLQWKTANEGSFTGFTLQKQLGTTFTGIDSLQSNGSGVYSYTDIKPTSGVNTYRLKQDGITGNITYSDLVIINYNYLSSDGTLSIYPNPTRGNVNIYVSLPDNTYKINIYNSFGGIMKQQTVSGTYWAEDVTAYNAGTYIIEMTDNKGKFVGKTKFVKIK